MAPLSGTPGDDKISEEEFALYFSKVMKLETAHAKALFRVADATRDGFLEYREFLGLMATLYRHVNKRGSGRVDLGRRVEHLTSLRRSQRPARNCSPSPSLGN